MSHLLLDVVGLLLELLNDMFFSCVVPSKEVITLLVNIFSSRFFFVWQTALSDLVQLHVRQPAFHGGTIGRSSNLV